MQSDQPTIINKAGVAQPITSVIFNENFIIVHTTAIGVRFEKVGDNFENGDFRISGDLSVFMPAPEVAIEDETADVTIDTAATPVVTPESIATAEATVEAATPAEGAVIGVDPAAEGGDTTVTETVGEVPAAPVTETTEVTQPVTTE